MMTMLTTYAQYDHLKYKSQEQKQDEITVAIGLSMYGVGSLLMSRVISDNDDVAMTGSFMVGVGLAFTIDGMIISHINRKPRRSRQNKRFKWKD